MATDFLESDIVQELKHLMNDERIQPEPEYKCFSKYFALKESKCEFLENFEILNLINSHGVHLKNDVKYWLDRGIEEKNDYCDLPVPVLNPKNFKFENFTDVLEKLEELPSEWTIIQITKKLSFSDITSKKNEDIVPGIHIAKFYGGKKSKKIQPFCITINEGSNGTENILKIPKSLAEIRREYFTLNRSCKKLYETYSNTNSELMNFVKELETHILKHWLCLFHGKLEDTSLEKETVDQITKLITKFCKSNKLKFPLISSAMEIIYQATLSAHFLKNKEIFTILKTALYPRESDLVNVSELKLLVEDIKMLNLSKECALKRATFNPVILILDSEFEYVPWEMITPLQGQPVCRISSLHLLYAVYKYHQPFVTNGYRLLEVDNIYSLINPSKDLESCEKHMKDFLKKQLPWAEKEIGIIPKSKDLAAKLKGYSVYLYCGHGSGTQYLKGKDLKKALVKGLVLLIGCSSNIPRNDGGQTPHHNNTYTYIINGCPCTIGCIQDVGSSDADAACSEMLTGFMPKITREGSQAVVSDPKEPNVLKSLSAAKSVCTKYWSKSAFVARGIPCKTLIGDKNKIISQLT